MPNNTIPTRGWSWFENQHGTRKLMLNNSEDQVKSRKISVQGQSGIKFKVLI